MCGVKICSALRRTFVALVLLAWTGSAPAQTTNASGSQSPRKIPPAAMARLDADHDGRISLEEFYPTGPEPLHPRMKQVFVSLDKEQRGSLSYADTAEAIAIVSSLMPKLAPEVDGAFQPIAIEVSPKSKRALIKATVNGVEGRFLLDTGTSDTILYPGFAKKAGADFVEICTHIVAGNYGKKGDTISLVRVTDMEIAGTHFRDFHAVLKAPVRKYEFGHDGQLDGVMGANVLFRKPLTLDYRKQQLTFSTNRWGPQDCVFDLLPGEKNTPCVNADLDGVKIELMFDSGAAIGDRLIVNESYHAAFRKLAGQPEARTYQSRELRVAGQVIATNKPCLLNSFEKTVIGSFFFDRHVITVDAAAGKMWVTRNPTP